MNSYKYSEEDECGLYINRRLWLETVTVTALDFVSAKESLLAKGVLAL